MFNWVKYFIWLPSVIIFFIAYSHSMNIVGSLGAAYLVLLLFFMVIEHPFERYIKYEKIENLFLSLSRKRMTDYSVKTEKLKYFCLTGKLHQNGGWEYCVSEMLNAEEAIKKETEISVRLKESKNFMIDAHADITRAFQGYIFLFIISVVASMIQKDMITSQTVLNDKLLEYISVLFAVIPPLLSLSFIWSIALHIRKRNSAYI